MISLYRRRTDNRHRFTAYILRCRWSRHVCEVALVSCMARRPRTLGFLCMPLPQRTAGVFHENIIAYGMPGCIPRFPPQSRCQATCLITRHPTRSSTAAIVVALGTRQCRALAMAGALHLPNVSGLRPDYSNHRLRPTMPVSLTRLLSSCSRCAILQRRPT